MALVPFLTVDGTEYPVANISYMNGEVHTVSFHTDLEYRTYYSAASDLVYREERLKIDFSTALKFVDNEAASKEDELFAHLEEVYAKESTELQAFTYEAFNSEDSPFEDVVLEDKKREFKLKQQRLLGMLDAIEEMKAFCEGYYERGE